MFITRGRFGARSIQAFLTRSRGRAVSDPITRPDDFGPQATPGWRDFGAEATHLGYAKSEGFAPEGDQKRDVAALYRPAARLGLNQWSLTGDWKIGEDVAGLEGRSGAITYRFNSRYLNLVMGPPPERWMWFVIKIDGARPGADCGPDTDADGWGRLDQLRLYQLVRQSGPVAERTLEIEFYGAGVLAYVFTFR